MGTTGLSFNHESYSKSALMKQQQQRQRITFLSCCSANLAVSLITTLITLLILFQIQTIRLPSTTFPIVNNIASVLSPAMNNQTTTTCSCCNDLEYARSRLRDITVFRPNRDETLLQKPFDNNTFFLSSINDTHFEDGMQYLYLPSKSESRLLCLTGDNRYALAWPDALLQNATLVKGLTYICDTYYEYVNLWHVLSAMNPFASWLSRKCEKPDQWMLFYHGHLTTNKLGQWGRRVMSAFTGREVVLIEDLGEAPKCFEKVLVFRNNEGRMQKMTRRQGYDMVRCKAREYCGVKPEEVAEGSPETIRLTLLMRIGARSFKDEKVVIDIFEKECGKVPGCKFKFAWGDNMTFCEQVSLLSKTDVLASPHGAQMTNFVFMEKNNSLLEMFPKGWLEYGGSGQYVFHWMADWVGMKHRGVWRDNEGPTCPHNDHMQCFFFHKNGKLGYDSAMGNFTAKVLNEAKAYRVSQASVKGNQIQTSCPCS